jgi:hypothetical protein
MSGPLTPIRYGGPPDLFTRKFGLGGGGLELRRWALAARPEDDEPGRATSARPPFGAVLGRPRLLDRKRDTADGNAGGAADLTLGAWVEDWASRSRAVRLSSLRVLGPLPRTGREPREGLVSTFHVFLQAVVGLLLRCSSSLPGSWSVVVGERSETAAR